ncbi:MAG: nucleotide exchange factor GrpE [Myxococcales bacterium]|nr:nucleotide exchange factor GrpE [Myxococcales bacterium]
MQEILPYLPWFLNVATLIFAGILLWSKSRDTKALQQTYEEQLQSFRRQHTETLLSQQDEHQATLRRRTREAEKQQERASFPLARDLLPVLDALEQARQSAQLPQSTPQDIAQGLQLLQHAFLQSLAQHDITPICPQPGEGFDPEIHEAIGIIETNDIPAGHIAQCLRTGWKHKVGLLRPATVQTAQAPAQPPVSQPPPNPIDTHQGP